MNNNAAWAGEVIRALEKKGFPALPQPDSDFDEYFRYWLSTIRTEVFKVGSRPISVPKPVRRRQGQLREDLIYVDRILLPSGIIPEDFDDILRNAYARMDSDESEQLMSYRWQFDEANCLLTLRLTRGQGYYKDIHRVLDVPTTDSSVVLIDGNITFETWLSKLWVIYQKLAVAYGTSHSQSLGNTNNVGETDGKSQAQVKGTVDSVKIVVTDLLSELDKTNPMDQALIRKCKGLLDELDRRDHRTPR